ncbi:TonB-dependent receptor [uncultured Flavobacterium sp.]|uniref:TonB-dependent receptor n=1 Tax=uncultured Flavobacterium sp. TaxID=165435 RepID=UPI0030EB3162|tara:strand:- start:4044 stop:6590 length:2547 start_codon:yes stop_codon:yes gene_type:complete
MVFIKRIYVLFFCFVFALSIKAQDRNKAIALKDILQTIEKQHHVYFNYIDNEIVFIKIVPPKKSLSLKKTINYLQKKTNLFFENIDNKSITIFSNTAIDTRKICGFVLAKEDNSPLEKVNIKFENGVGTSTNKKGYFELKKDKSTDLLISCVGYTSKKISLNDFQNNNCSKIYLEVELLELNNIITNLYLTSGISKKNYGTFEIKPKRLGILPGLIEPDVLQTMLQIPGIYSTDESISNINVRGGTHDQNLFLWNGIKMYQTGHFFGLISAFNPNLAHTISITKNGSSAFFGEGVSSVVAISSNPNKLEKNSFSAGINMINADVYSKFNINKKGFLEIAVRKSITDLVKTPTYKEYNNKAFQNTNIIDFFNKQNSTYSSDEKFNFYDITAKFSQKIGQKDHLIVDFITINDQLKVFQTSKINNVVLSENNNLSQKNYGANLSWKRNWNAKNYSTINVYSSSYALNAEKNKIQDNLIVRQENKVLDTGLKLENSKIIGSKFTFNTGYQLNEIGTVNLDQVNKPIFYRRIKEVLRTHAVIAEGKFNDTLSKIYLSTGLRLNYIEQFNKYILEPRLHFNYTATKHLNLEVLGEFKSQYSYQVIDQQEDYFGIEKRRWIVANNTTIPIQRSKQASINLFYTQKNWLITFENFFKKINGINSSGQGFQNQLEFVKINGNYETLGSEILVQKKINHFISWLSYAYNYNNYNFPNSSSPIFPNNFKLEHIISWAGIYQKKNLKLAIGSKWYSGKPTTSLKSDVINYSDFLNPKIDYNSPNNKILDDFFQVNFSATYKWKDSNDIQYKLGFSILNLFNRKNEINEFHNINAITNSIEDVKTFSIHRTPNLSFRMTY